MRIDLVNWDTENTLYFTVTSYKIGKENVNECEGYRYYSNVKARKKNVDSKGDLGVNRDIKHVCKSQTRPGVLVKGRMGHGRSLIFNLNGL